MEPTAFMGSEGTRSSRVRRITPGSTPDDARRVDLNRCWGAGPTDAALRRREPAGAPVAELAEYLTDARKSGNRLSDGERPVVQPPLLDQIAGDAASGWRDTPRLFGILWCPLTRVE